MIIPTIILIIILMTTTKITCQVGRLLPDAVAALLALDLTLIVIIVYFVIAIIIIIISS